jgi:hypothetical protein
MYRAQSNPLICLKSLLHLQAEIEEYVKKGEKPPADLLNDAQPARDEKPLYWPTNWPEVAQQLQPGEGTLDRMKAFSPLTSRLLAHLMLELRLFSFSAA